MGQQMSGLGVGLSGIVIGGVAGAYAGYQVGAALARAVNARNYANMAGIAVALIGVQYGIGLGPQIAIAVAGRLGY